MELLAFLTYKARACTISRVELQLSSNTNDSDYNVNTYFRYCYLKVPV